MRIVDGDIIIECHRAERLCLGIEPPAGCVSLPAEWPYKVSIAVNVPDNGYSPVDSLGLGEGFESTMGRQFFISSPLSSFPFCFLLFPSFESRRFRTGF